MNHFRRTYLRPFPGLNVLRLCIQLIFNLTKTTSLPQQNSPDPLLDIGMVNTGFFLTRVELVTQKLEVKASLPEDHYRNSVKKPVSSLDVTASNSSFVILLRAKTA